MGKQPVTKEDADSYGNCQSDVSNVNSCESNLKVLTVNIQGLECFGRLEQIRTLLVKHSVSVAVVTETETSHSIAETSNIEGFKAFIPPKSVTGPLKKEVGVIVMISNELSLATTG